MNEIMYKESNNNNKKTFEIKLQLSSANAKKKTSQYSDTLLTFI